MSEGGVAEVVVKKSKKAKEVTVISVPPLKIADATITLVGDSPLICHAWSVKAKQMILDKHMKKHKAAKEAKDPEQDVLDSLYPMGDGTGYGFPSLAFKAAAVDACSFVDGVTKVEARGAFQTPAGLIRINGTHTGREDMVRVGMGTADIRHRGEFKEWSCVVPIRYNVNALSLEQIVNLFNIAGFAIGVGEWRPAKDGNFGMFHVA